METNECEWCYQFYPKGAWDYYEVTVIDKKHKICSDCYEHLEKIKEVEDDGTNKR